jgi:anti-sigma B factor antagonist
MPAPQPDPIRVEIVDGVTVISFPTTRLVTEDLIQTIGNQLYQMVDERGVTKMLISFRDVKFMASALIGKLMNLNKKITNAGGQLKLTNLGPPLLEVFKIGKFDKVLSVYEDEQAALDAF